MAFFIYSPTNKKIENHLLTFTNANLIIKVTDEGYGNEVIKLETEISKGNETIFSRGVKKMDILVQRTESLYNEVKGKIETGEIKTVDEVAVAIVKGAEERSVSFREMKEHVAFYIMGEIDSESLYQMVESN